MWRILNEPEDLQETKLPDKRIIRSSIFAGIFIASLIISLIAFCSNERWERRICYFPSYSGGNNSKIYTEVRYLPRAESYEEDVKSFVKDLILGPMTNRYKRLFSRQTTLDFLFLREGTLYIGLSEDALSPDSETFDIAGNVSLLKTNIERNFPDVKEVDTLVYIGNRLVSL